MMEKTIIFPKAKDSEILVTHVEDVISDNGIINVFDKEGTQVGHVVHHIDWVFRSISESMEAATLAEIMVEYNHLTFKVVF